MSLAGQAHNALRASRTLCRIPTLPLSEFLAVTACEKQEKQTLLQGGTGPTPALLRALDCARRDAQEVGHLRLVQPQLVACPPHVQHFVPTDGVRHVVPAPQPRRSGACAHFPSVSALTKEILRVFPRSVKLVCQVLPGPPFHSVAHGGRGPDRALHADRVCAIPDPHTGSSGWR